MSSKHLTPLSNTEAASFCSQMALILKSGISSIEGIAIMREDAKDPGEKELLAQIYESILQTGSLYESLKKTNAFPDYLLQMVQIGEQAGKLDEVMASLSDYYEKEASLTQTLKNTITYPLIMSAMMLCVILVLVMKVMPVFNQVFAQFGREMTGVSLAVLRAGEFLNRHFIPFACILAALVLSVIFLVRHPAGQKHLHSFFNRFSRTRKLSERIWAYRFSNGMALTLSSGLTPEECLRLAVQLIDEGPYKRRLEECCTLVENGTEICQSLLDNGIFTGIHARMAAVGSRMGMLDDVMNTIARQYEEEIDVQFARLTAKIEPTMVIVLSVFVGVILLSVMLPLIGIMSSL